MSKRKLAVEFFVDRSLGRKHLPEALRAEGMTVHTMASVYGENRAQSLKDVDWLADAGKQGWVVLHKDSAIRRRPAELQALRNAKLRTFCLVNAQLKGHEQTARFIDNLEAIIRRSSRPGPFIYAISERGLRKIDI